MCINLIWNTKVLSYSFLVNLICLQNKDTKANHCTFCVSLLDASDFCQTAEFDTMGIKMCFIFLVPT